MSNCLVAFRPSRPVVIHIGPQLCNSFTRAIGFFSLYFTDEMIDEIYSDNFATEDIFQGTYTTYTKQDGSWGDFTPYKVRRLIELLVYFGNVRLAGDVDKYWSTKIVYQDLWARAFLAKERSRAIIGLLLVVDSDTEDPVDTLRKIESFIRYMINVKTFTIPEKKN